jgi:ATP-binding cassette subfamily C protein LapB
MTEETIIPEREGRFASWLAEPMLANKSTYFKVACAAMMINIFGLATSLFTMTVYDRVVPNNATASLIALSIGLFIVIIFDFVLRTLRAYFLDIAGAQIDKEIGDTIFQRMLRIRLDLKKGSTGMLTGLMRELETLRDFFASATVTAIVDVPFIFLTLLVIFLIGGPVVLVPAILVPIVIGVGLATQPALDRMSRKAMTQGLLKQTVLVETIGGLETVKATSAGDLLSKRWLDSIRQHSDFSLRQRLVGAISVNAAAAAQMLSYAGVVIVGVNMIQSQSLSLGGLIACSILSGRCVAPLGQIASLLSRITMTRTAYRQINEVMQVPSEGPETGALSLKEIRGAIEFKDVSFRYPDAAERALHNVSFAIKPGERVALLGRVGSGKSTVARLVLGLFPPEDGLVMVDGIDIRQLEPHKLREHIGAALQESVLLSGTVRENIGLGREGVDDTEIVRAATISGTHQFMGKITNGYDLRLADRGEGLSGGQRQSIAIARAIAGRPPVFVLDEPTSAMDAQTEAALLERLDEEMAGKTLILVTHRPPMMRLVNRVILLDGGRVVADGPRDAVLEKIQGKSKASPKVVGVHDARKKPDTPPSSDIISSPPDEK